MRVRGGFRVMVGDSLRVRVRKRVSFMAKGWLEFMYYGPKLFELKLRSGGGFGKKNKIVQRINQQLLKFYRSVTIFHISTKYKNRLSHSKIFRFWSYSDLFLASQVRENGQFFKKSSTCLRFDLNEPSNQVIIQLEKYCPGHYSFFHVSAKFDQFWPVLGKFCQYF